VKKPKSPVSSSWIKNPIANRALKSTDIPARISARWDEFALTFDGYEYHGSVTACAKIANRKKPTTLTEYRTCLFFEQRRFHHFGVGPDGEDLTYIRTLLAGIRKIVKARARQ
jgi:hypothetical protein